MILGVQNQMTECDCGLEKVRYNRVGETPGKEVPRVRPDPSCYRCEILLWQWKIIVVRCDRYHVSEWNDQPQSSILWIFVKKRKGDGIEAVRVVLQGLIGNECEDMPSRTV